MIKSGEDRKCKTCGRGFYIKLSAIKKGRGKFCSPNCFHSSRRIKVHKKRCEACGDSYRPQSIRHSKTSKYCSKECFNSVPKSEETRRKCSESHKKLVSKSWRGGITSRYQSKYRSYKWGIIKRAVYLRDKNICQDCNVYCKKHNISCHHLVPFRVSGDDRLTNLVTLCTSCHAKADYKYRESEQYEK